MNAPVTRVQQRPLPDPATCHEWLGAMLLLRRFDERAGELHAAGRIGGELRLAIGEEATIVGATRALENRDWFVSAFRQHAGALVRGTEPARVLAELLGRVAGVRGGYGGPLHAGDGERRVITGPGDGHEVALAAGVALAATQAGRSEVVLCLTGTGAPQRGVYAEALAVAAAQRLPVVVAVAANQVGLPDASAPTAPSALTRQAEGIGVKALRADGMDLLEVHAAVSEAVRIARGERRPVVVELLTHRTREASLADPNPYAGRERMAEWKQRDPIVRFGDRVVEVGLIERSERTRLQMQAGTLIEQAVSAASRSGEPDPASPPAGAGA